MVGRFDPNEFERVDILRRLLKLARAGKIGAVYCDRRPGVRLGIDAYGNTQWLSWSAARKLAATWVEPVERKPVASTNRLPKLPGRTKSRTAQGDR